MTGGILTIGGVQIAVAGVTVGGVLVTEGVMVGTAAVMRMGDDWNNFTYFADSSGNGSGELTPQNLMNELANSGVKYNPNDVIMVTKTPDGKLVWLEKGNNKSGFMHIFRKHANDFAKRGIKDIPTFLHKTLQNTPIRTGTNRAGPFAEFLIEGSKYTVAYGTNGYIVSFYPS